MPPRGALAEQARQAMGLPTEDTRALACRVQMAGTFTIAAGVSGDVLWNTERWDRGGMWDQTVDAGATIKLRAAGIWILEWSLTLSAIDALVSASIRVNNTPSLDLANVTFTAAAWAGTVTADLRSGDTIKIAYASTSASSRAIAAGAFLSVYRQQRGGRR